MVEDPPLPLPIDGVLDLHAFAPSEVKDLVGTYLEECARLGIKDVRLIHGKGTGTLRRIVRRLLQDHPLVDSFGDADPLGGSWGATVVRLK